MRQTTRQLLSSLEGSTLFRAVGTGGSEDGVAHAGSWQEAFESCSSDEWKELRVEQANAIRLPLQQSRMNLWNGLVRQIRPDVTALVDEQVDAVSRFVPSPQAIANAAAWDILHACMEWEYAEDIATRFYRDLAVWYAAGRFPCGWEGEFPQGRLIVY